MKHVLKYQITNDINQAGIKKATLKLPYYSDIVSVEVQRGILCIWVESEVGTTEFVDTDFILIETGDEFPDNTKFVGTVHHTGWVWHLYEMTR